MKLKWNRLLVFPLIIAVLGVWLLWPHSNPKAGWFDEGYRYRQKISFTHNAAISSARAVTFSLDTAEIIGNGAMQSDCDDVRFTDVNGDLLIFQKTGTCNNAATTYEIVFPSIINGSNVGYVYYGNSSATSASQDVSAITALTPNGGDPAITDVTNQETGPGPVLSWDMNENYGSTIQDSTLNANNGTMGTSSSAPAWVEDSLCVEGSCLRFDGSNDYVSKTYSSDTELDPSTGSFTVSVWAKHSSNISGTDVIISRVDGATANGVGYKLYMDSSGYLCFGIDQTAGSFPANSACSSTSYADSKWHHISGVKDTTASKIYLYIDGKEVTNAAYTAGSLSGSSPAFRIGIDNGAANPWDGFIDSLKVYPYARSADQVKTDSIAHGSVKGVGTQMGASDMNKKLSDGLVGYWKMDENTGNTILDYSGSQGTSSTFTGNVAFAAGKYGTGLTFDGTNDVVRIPENSAIDLGDTTDSYTVSTWFKSPTLPDPELIVAKESGTSPYPYRLWTWSSVVYFDIYANSQVVASTDNSVNYSDNNWHLITGVRDASNRTVSLYVDGELQSTVADTSTISAKNNADVSLGNGSGSYITFDYSGSIDETRIYNRALSPSEISALYKWAPGPSVYYDLNENTGTSTVYDKSGNGLSGSMSGGIAESAWVPGKFGPALELDGASDYLNLSNSATNSNINESQGTISFWYKMNGGLGSSYRELLQLRRSDDNDAMELYLQSTSSALRFEYNNSGSINRITGATPTVGTWYHVAAVWRSNGTTELYVNGVSVGTTSSYSLVNTQIDSIYVGADFGSSTNTSATFDDIKIYTYARTPGQIIEDMNGGHPIGGSPIGSQVGYWKFDEGYGDTANNIISGKTNGDLGVSTTCPGNATCPTWSTNGKFNNALTFDGSNTQVQMANDAYTDTQGSISAWIKLAVLPTDGTAFSIYTTASTTSSTNLFVFDVIQPPGLNPRLRIGSRSDLSFMYGDTVLTTGTWYHVVGKSDGSAWSLYVNGKKQTLTIQSGTGAGSGHWFSQEASGTMLHTIGALRRSTGTNSYFNGTIDEVKVYNTPLTDDEVKIDYNRGSSTVLGYSSTASDGVTADNSTSREYCIPGDTSTCNPPIGEWQFNENTGTSSTADTSGNNNNASFNGSITASQWTRGKTGSAISFDGNNDYVQADNTTLYDMSTSTPFTITGWFKSLSPGSTQNIFMGVNNTSNYYRVQLNGGYLRAQLVDTSGSSFCTIRMNSYTVDDGKWHYFAAQFYRNASCTTSDILIYLDGLQQSTTLVNTGLLLTANLDESGIRIGGNSSYFSGPIDNIRFYNYIRTPAQIAWEYNRGGPAAWYQLNECQGTTAYDSSPNNNPDAVGINGTITIGATGSNTSAGTCSGASTEAWKNGANGKINSSLSFDGSNDYVSITDSTNSPFDFASGQQMTISAWIKPTSLPSNGNYASIVAKAGTNGNGYYAQIYSSGQMEFCIFSTVDGGCYTTTLSPVTTGAWQHLTYSFTVGDSTSIKMYYNGKQYTGSWTDNGNTIPDADNATVYIGATDSTGEFFKGLIDDVQIFRYALTDTQLKTVINNSSAVNFAPVTGSP